jgi:hypothetical protein
MDTEFSNFQQEVRETNKASQVALECATFVLRRALELPQDRRKGMIERLKKLVSVTEEGPSFIPLPNGPTIQNVAGALEERIG